MLAHGPLGLPNLAALGERGVAAQTIGPILLVTSSNVIFQLTVEVAPIEPVYNYPVGHSLYADYGLRASKTFYKQRLVLGRRPR